MSQYVRQRWGPGSGFPGGPVYSITQTADGYLWIGTEKGLIRFDGYSFRLMEATLAQQGPLTHVLGLVPDADGSLWVRLRRPTLLRYRDDAFEDAMDHLERPRPTAAAIARAADGSLLMWALEGEPRAVKLHGKKLETLAAPPKFSRSPVLALEQTANGDIWVGTRDAGLFRSSGVRTTAIRDGLPDLKVNALVTAPNGELWVGSDAGVARWDGARLTQSGVPSALRGVQALSMTIDQDRNLWVGTNSNGLIRVNAQGAAATISPATVTNDAVTAIFEDREGNLWIGTSRGLERWSDSPFVTYSSPEGLPADGSIPVYVDELGRTWFAPVTGGLWWIQDGQRGQISGDGLQKDLVYSLDGAKGEVWAGRQRGGLTRIRFDKGSSFQVKTYTSKDGLTQDSVFAVYRSKRDGSVWSGTLSGGVSRLEDGRFTTYGLAQGLASNSVLSILEDSRGTMWFATPGGLSAFANNQWKTFAAAEGLRSPVVNCLLEDSTRSLWAGGAAGLAVLTQGRFQVPPNIPLALRESILGLAEDRFGFLWIATSNHVLRVNRDRLRNGELTAADVREYGLDDGLRGHEGVKRHKSVVADDAGRNWFSLNKGISVVDPARLRYNSTPAIVHVQSIVADGRAIRPSPGVHIPGGAKRITIGFAGLSLSAPERVRYRYRLDAFDRHWSEPAPGREAVYTNLPPGTFEFRVMASNSDGVWSDAEAAIARFEVDPLLWQTAWFRAGIVVLLALCGFSLYRFRMHQVARRLNARFEERLSERTRIAQELHDTLLQGFISASMQLHVAAEMSPDDQKTKPALNRTLQLMSQVVEEGRNAVSGLRSTNSALLDLEHALSRVQEELASQGVAVAAVAFRVVADGEPRKLNPLLRDEAYRIGREALVNAFRHSGASRIEVEVRYGLRRLWMTVRDNGKGLDPRILESVRHEGQAGLISMRERAERIGAKLRCSSDETGTEVELSVPGLIAYRDRPAAAWTWIRRRFDASSNVVVKDPEK